MLKVQGNLLDDNRIEAEEQQKRQREVEEEEQRIAAAREMRRRASIEKATLSAQQKADFVQRDAMGGGPATVGPTKSAAAEGPSDEDVEYWFKIMQEKMTTRFSELRRAFRTLDEDASGSLDREEFKQVLIMFNLGIPRHCTPPSRSPVPFALPRDLHDHLQENSYKVCMIFP